MLGITIVVVSYYVRELVSISENIKRRWCDKRGKCAERTVCFSAESERPSAAAAAA